MRAPEVLERVTRAAVEDDTAYLEATVKEILRRRPVLPIAGPRRIKQEVEIGGRAYAPGPAFAACIYLVHHDARIYPEPYAFRPERFLDGKPGKFSWIPFGGGVRRCLGASFAQLEMRIALRAILSQVEVASALDGREGIGRRSITLSPRRGHADLRAPARARAAVGAQRLISRARTRARNIRASFSEPLVPGGTRKAPGRGRSRVDLRPASGARPGCDHALVPRWTCLLAGLALVVSACGGDAKKQAKTPPAPKPSATATPAAEARTPPRRRTSQ